ncbi:class I SAM-dependent methyltransferase [Cohnella cellulosilytica]|uniref:Class I SAM-dependent methyltransferase n=1 Tax=Cohnella cellulosilytica TaxID=986710 RepID=A0ABW2FMG9_9BACL
MVQWNDLNQESKNRWETIAEFWDDYMGDESNRFHRELIKPYTEKLLQIEPSHEVLDIACGNGNFSRRLAELGAIVTAFDYSSKWNSSLLHSSSLFSNSQNEKDPRNGRPKWRNSNKK